MSSNVGRWTPWYSKEAADSSPLRYGDDTVFLMAAKFLSGLAVEDWGCGFARYKQFHLGAYVGIDGTAGFCDVVADLREYRSDTPAVLMRAVLEHDTEWRLILANALSSAKKRIVVAVFTPDGEGEQIGWTEELGVPDLAIPHGWIDQTFQATGWKFDRATVATDTFYGSETVWRGRR